MKAKDDFLGEKKSGIDSRCLSRLHTTPLPYVIPARKQLPWRRLFSRYGPAPTRLRYPQRKRIIRDQQGERGSILWLDFANPPDCPVLHGLVQD